MRDIGLLIGQHPLISLFIVVLIHYLAFVLYFWKRLSSGARKFNIASYLQYFDFCYLFNDYIYIAFEKVEFKAQSIKEDGVSQDFSAYKDIDVKLKLLANTDGLKKLHELLFDPEKSNVELPSDLQQETAAAFFLSAYFYYMHQKKYQLARSVISKAAAFNFKTLPTYRVYILMMATEFLDHGDPAVFAEKAFLKQLNGKTDKLLSEKLVYLHGIFFRHGVLGKINLWPLSITSQIKSISGVRKNPAVFYYIAIYYGVHKNHTHMKESLMRTLFFGKEQKFYPRLLRNNFLIKGQFPEVYERAIVYI